MAHTLYGAIHVWIYNFCCCFSSLLILNSLQFSCSRFLFSPIRSTYVYLCIGTCIVRDQLMCRANCWIVNTPRCFYCKWIVAEIHFCLSSVSLSVFCLFTLKSWLSLSMAYLDTFDWPPHSLHWRIRLCAFVNRSWLHQILWQYYNCYAYMNEWISCKQRKKTELGVRTKRIKK